MHPDRVGDARTLFAEVAGPLLARLPESDASLERTRLFGSAISVGIVEGTPLLDLEYVEDVACDTDMNVVMTGAGNFVEVQGTAEGAAFDRAELDALLNLAEGGCADLTRMQQAALGG